MWDRITAEELRIAAKVARASGGHILAGAADAWELRANLVEQHDANRRIAFGDLSDG